MRLPAVKLWAAWNEPNNPVFLQPQYRYVGGKWVIQSAIDYARICEAVYAGVHAARVSGDKVACGLTAPRGNNNPGEPRASVAPLTFLKAVHAAGLKHFDAWAHHPYYVSPSETPSSKPNSATAVTLGNIQTLIDQVTKYYGRKPIWITEYGYQTNPPDAFFGVSWAKQAAYLTQAFAIARKNPRIDDDALVPPPRRAQRGRLAVGPGDHDRPEEAGVQRFSEAASLRQLRCADPAGARRIALADSRRSSALASMPI